MSVKNCFLLLFALYLGTLRLVAQSDYPQGEWRGKVVDSLSGRPVELAMLTLYAETEAKPKMLTYTTSKRDGQFTLSVPRHRGKLFVEISLMGYRRKRFVVSVPYTEQTLRIKEEPYDLSEVLVQGPPIHARGDTIVFRADKFATPSVHTLEDLIKRLPGLSVDNVGVIRWHGENIAGVQIEDLDLMGRRYQAISQTLRAEQVQSLELIEDHQAVKAKQGIVSGNKAMLNIRLKNKNMLLPSGELGLSLGQLGERKTIYALNLKTLLVNSKTQILAVGGANNSEQNISHQAHAQGQRLAFNPMRRLLPSNQTQTIGARESLEGSRYGATLNQILRFGKHTTGKYNVGYGDISQEGKQTLVQDLYDGTTDNFLTIREQSQRRVRDRQGYLTLDYTKNAPKTYISNILDLQADWLRRNYDLVRNDVPIAEEGRMHEFRVRDHLSLVQRRTNNNLSEWQIAMHYNNLPLGEVMVPAQGSYHYRQAISGKDAGFSTNAGFGWYLGGHINMDLGIHLEGRLLEGTSNLSTEHWESLVRGEALIPKATASLRYRNGSLRWNLSFPLGIHLEHYRYTTLEGGRDRYRSTRYSPGLVASLYYDPTASLKVRSLLSYNRDYMHDLTSFVFGPLRTSYDRLVRRDHLLLPYATGWRFLTNIHYKRPVYGFFSRWQLIASTSESNTLTARSVNEEGSQSQIVEHSSRQHTLSTDVYLSKYLDILGSTITLEFGGKYLQSPSLEGGRLGELVNRTWYIRPNISAKPWDFLLIEIAGQYGQDNYKRGRIDRSNSNLSWRAKVDLSLGKYWAVGARYAYSRTYPDRLSYPSVSFVDADLSYRRTRWHYTLELRNLLGVDVYRRVSYVASDIWSSSIYQRPRQLLLSVRYKF